jgi:hypothetical protein
LKSLTHCLQMKAGAFATLQSVIMMVPSMLLSKVAASQSSASHPNLYRGRFSVLFRFPCFYFYCAENNHVKVSPAISSEYRARERNLRCRLCPGAYQQECCRGVLLKTADDGAGFINSPVHQHVKKVESDEKHFYESD